MSVIFKCDKCGKEADSVLEYAHGWQAPDGWGEHFDGESGGFIIYCPKCKEEITVRNADND